jgi:hypothetical protein
MKITFKSAFAAIATLLMPGLGHLFYGKWGWAFFWFFAAAVTAGLTLGFAAIHCLILGNE